jgi:predicted aspartyl protease
MIDDMGSFRIDLEVGGPTRTGARREIRNVLVDTGAELSCFPGDVLDAVGIVRGKQLRFRQADGGVLVRWTGSGIVYAANTYATDDLVFGEPGDLVLLGSRSLEGLNVRVDPIMKTLIHAGPMPMAASGFLSEPLRYSAVRMVSCAARATEFAVREFCARPRAYRDGV